MRSAKKNWPRKRNWRRGADGSAAASVDLLVCHMPVMVPSATLVIAMSCACQTSDVMLRQRMTAALAPRREKERVEP